MATTGHENESINIGGLKSSLQALKTKFIDDLDSRTDILEEALSTGGSVDTRISAAVNALDANKSQAAGADGLALSVSEENGKITSISGSIASNTYDSYGAASTVKTELLGDAASDYNTLGKLEDKIQAEATRAESAEESLDGRVDTLEDTVGTGGSVNSRISSAVATETTRAQAAENSKANKAITLSGYGIENAYTKDEVNNIIAPLVPTKNLYGGSWEAGCLHSDGLVYPEHLGFLTSDFIPMGYYDELVAKINYVPPADLYPYFCYYDSNKTLVQSEARNPGSNYARTVFGITSGYMRISINEDYNYWIFYGKSITATNDQLNAIATGAVSPFNALSRLYNKKVGFLGDSIIAYNHIVNAYQLKTHCVAVNYGISGTTIALYPTVGNNAMCVRYANMADDLDMVVVLGGVNDHRSGVPLGEFKYYNSDGALNNTFYGALHTLMRGLKEKYPTKPIVFMTPMHNSYRDAQYGDTGDYNYAQFQNGILVENKYPLNNGNIDDSIATGGVLTEYVDAIKKVAAFYSIFVIDLYAISSLQPLLDSNKSRYLPDGIHPDEHGGARISDIIYPYLEDMFEG